MWSKPFCKYCTMAQQHLESKGYTVQIKKIGGEYTVEDFFAAVPSGVRTVPQIYVNDKYIGGYTELIADATI